MHTWGELPVEQVEFYFIQNYTKATPENRGEAEKMGWKGYKKNLIQ